MYLTLPETCARKVAYSAEPVARNAATALGWLGLTLYVYQCDCCLFWHLTHYRQSSAPVQPA